MARKYKIHDQQELYFVTFTVVNWIDVFTRDAYRQIFLNSVKYCQQNKGLNVGAWVIMINHIHMIIGTNGDNKLQDIIRDLKSFVSRQMRLTIEQNSEESRRGWIIWMLKRAGMANSKNNNFQFWIQDNHPIQLSTGEMLLERLNYIHNNPVKAGFVAQPDHWLYSSAHDYCGGTQGLIDLMMLL
ncbi:MAG: transposase [Taibaiella sp.]|nr:transposase [Taibaiella sp.]